METVTGYVTGINGNLANVSFDGAVHKNEVLIFLLMENVLKERLSESTMVLPACRSTRCQMVSKSEIR